MDSRTNNQVESHNGHLGRIVGRSKTFVGFADNLIEEDQRKGDQLHQTERKLDKVFEAQKARYKARDKAIAVAQERLRRGDLEIPNFLVKMAKDKPTCAAKGACVASDDDESEPEEPEELDPSVCVRCRVGARAVQLLPCTHFVVCDACAEVTQMCPDCLRAVTGSRRVFAT